jgi:hypothetical protein
MEIIFGKIRKLLSTEIRKEGTKRSKHKKGEGNTPFTLL